MIHCKYCQLDKEESEFYTNTSTKRGFDTMCKCCRKQYNKDRRIALPLATRTEYLKRVYGLTLEAYAEMLESQGGGCAICGKPPSERAGRFESLSVDHDHSCCPTATTCGNCIRGLLCHNCNMTIGKAEAMGLETLNNYVNGRRPSKKHA